MMRSVSDQQPSVGAGRLRPAGAPGLSPWLFLVLSIAVTWVFWWPAAVVSGSHPAISRLLHYAGGAGPLFVTVILLVVGPTALRRSYRARLARLRFSAGWWATVVLLPVFVTALAVLCDRLLGNAAAFDPLSDWASHPVGALSTAALLLVFGPLPEELAWRGYGLPRLREGHGPLVSTLLLGGTWALWHLPLFWVQGSYQAGLGAGTGRFWLYFAAALATAFLYTWVWEGTASTPAAIVLHFSVNCSGELFSPSPRVDGIRTAVYAVAAIMLALVWLRGSASRDSGASQERRRA